MLASMPAAELAVWMRLRSRELIGDERRDFLAGQICSTIATYAGKSLPDGASMHPEDFIPWGSERELPTQEELDRKVEAAMSAMMAPKKR